MFNCHCSVASSKEPVPSLSHKRIVEAAGSSPVHGHGRPLARIRSASPSWSMSQKAAPLPIVSGSSFSPRAPLSWMKSIPASIVMSVKGSGGADPPVSRIWTGIWFTSGICSVRSSGRETHQIRTINTAVISRKSKLPRNARPMISSSCSRASSSSSGGFSSGSSLTCPPVGP